MLLMRTLLSSPISTRLLLVPVLLPKAVDMGSYVQIHKHSVCASPTPLPHALLGSSLTCWDPLQIQPVLDSPPGSWLTLPSLLHCPGSPKSCFQVLLVWGLPYGQGSSPEFTLSYILASKPPRIRMRKKCSVGRNDSSWVCEGEIGGKAAWPEGGPTIDMTAFPPTIPNLHNQDMNHFPLSFPPDRAQSGAVLCGGCLPLPS